MNLSNLDLMRSRLEFQGGIKQEDRMIKGKWRTLQRALKYSYQGCDIQLVQKYSTVLDADPDALDPEMGISPLARALINPDKLKQEYDDKIVSVDYADGFEAGDIFQWVNTDTYWIIYNQALTEDAYFRGEIRRCRHRIKFKDTEGKWCATWAAVRGPVETQINSIQKNQLRIDEPNLSLNILMPLNEITRPIFDRYGEFLYDGRCWRVEAPDTISMKNIIEINAEEYYVNPTTDDMPNEMKDGLVIEEEPPKPQSSAIKGETFIKPKIEEVYEADEDFGKWCVVEKNVPVVIKNRGNRSVYVTWGQTTHGQFTLRWTSEDKIRVEEKVIVVESLY